MHATLVEQPRDSALAPAPDDARPTGWGRVVLISLILFSGSGLRLIFTPMQEAAKLDLHFTDVQIGMIHGFAQGLPILLFAIPIGLAIDHANRARLMLALAILWTAGTLWTAFAGDFTSMFLARGVVGLGTGCAVAVATSMVADLCRPETRGRVLILAGLGPVAGVAIAFALGGSLFGHFNHGHWVLVPGLAAWRQATLAFGLFGLVMLVPIALFREPKRYEVEQKSKSIMPALRGLWRRRGFLGALFVGQMAGGLAEGAAGIWAAPVLSRNFGLQPNDFGGWMGGIVLIAGIGGAVIGGFAADWGHRRKVRGGILIGAIVATVFSTPASAYAAMPSVGLFGLALGILLLACTVAGMIGATAVAVLIPNEERGVCLAISGVIGTLVSLATAPLVAMMGNDLFGGEQHIGLALAVLGIVTGLIALVGYIVAMLTAPPRPTEA